MSDTIFKRSLLTSTVMAGLCFAAPAYAQQQTQPQLPPAAYPEQEADPVEQTVEETVTETNAEGQPIQSAQDIVVTGSRIRRPNIENSVPTAVIGEEFFEATNATNFADVANQLPQFMPSFGASRTQSTFSGAATSGLQLVNLRNLGGGRTLTLLNGRRMPGGTTTGTSVDFNTIPAQNIDRVEVITGGASAIYGADAVAGVVNIITRSTFTGIEVGGSYRISQRGDDATPMGYMMFGADVGDGGHVLVTGEVTKQGQVGCDDRYLCAEDFFWQGGRAAPFRGPVAYSGVGPFGRFFTGALTAPDNAGFTRTGELFDVTIHGFNRNAARTLAQDTERFMVAAEANYEIYDWLVPFVELNYGLARTQADFEGHPFQSNAAGSRFGGGPGVTGLNPSIPVYIPTVAGSGVTCTAPSAACMVNPIVPQWLLTRVLAANPAASEITWWHRFGLEGTQQRGAENERQMFRGVAGVRGEFDIGLINPWNYEAHYVHGQTTLNSLTQGLISTRQLYYGLRTEPVPGQPGQFRCADVGARAVGCIPFNPFDGISQAEADALNVDAGQSGRSQLRDFQAYVSGDVFRLPGGNFSVAFGVENRSFSGFLDYDEVINNAEVTGNQIGDVEFSKRSTKEAFVEGIAPILGGLSFLNNLTLEGAYRFSSPSVGKNYNTWRYGGVAEFIPGLRARAMRAKAVREPTPGELGGIGQNFGVITDPCIDDPATPTLRRTDPTVAAACLAAGVPVGYNPPLVVRQGTGGFVGGNPNLEPEQAKTQTLGLSLAPPRSGPLGFLNGLQLTVDRFKIKMDDVVGTVGRQVKVNRCYQFGQFCADVQRGVHPLVAGPYALIAVNDQLINVATWDIRGFDFEARYSMGLPLFGREGRLSLQALATHYTKADITNLPGEDPDDWLGYLGGSTGEQGWVKWSGVGNIGYRVGGTGINWNIRYIGHGRPAPFLANPPIHDEFYHNLRLSQRVGTNYEFFAGVNNLMDKDPPFFPSGTAGTQALDTIPAYYDVFGRSFFAGFRLSF